VNDETLRSLLEARASGEAVVLATDLTTGEEELIRPFAAHQENAGALVEAALVEAARDAALADRSQTLETEAGRTFLHVFNPPLRLVVVGAVHIAQPLSAMAAEAGYDVTVVDPRAAFTTEERFPGTELVRSWPEEALAKIGLDSRTAVVTVTHDPKLDDPALRAALASDVFYIGALGSRRTHDARLKRLREAGLSEEDLLRIHAPVGLDLGARTPGEIAASVVAQIIQVLRAGSG